MRVINPKELEQRRHQRDKMHKKRKRKLHLLPMLLALVTIYSTFVMLVPQPVLQAQMTQIKLPAATPVSMPWPSYGQAAIGALGYGLLAQNGAQTPLPIASVAKVLTAVAVLKVKPIKPGTQGETITFTAQDVATYNKYLSEGHSVVPVEAGEQLTLYQALQALLLPSANNVADALAVWAFGSTENYLTFVNPFTKTIGMNNTNIDDPSGFSPRTTSVAVDLAKLAEIAMNNPTIAEIVGQPEANLPVAGTIYNVNRLLGKEGIVGIKTGNTDEAGGCYMFSARRKIDASNEVTVFGAVLGAPDRNRALDDSLPLINEAFKNFRTVTPLNAQNVVGTVSRDDGVTEPVIVGKGVSIVAWAGLPIKTEFTSEQLSSHVNTGEQVGTLALLTGNMSHKVPVIAGGTIQKRSLMWRLKNAGGLL